jgi:hypothetical protein
MVERYAQDWGIDVSGPIGTIQTVLDAGIKKQAELVASLQASLNDTHELVWRLLAEVKRLQIALRVCADSDSILMRQEIKNKALGGGE